MKHIAKFIICRRSGQGASLFVVDCLIFGGTNSVTTNSFMLVVGFLLLSASIYYLLNGLLLLAGLYGFHSKRKRRLPLVLTALCAGLIALQSMGQLGSHDVLVSALLVLLFYVYTSHAKSLRQNLTTT